MLRTLLAATLALTGLTPLPAAADFYDPPADCTVVATMRMDECVVAHVSQCPDGNIEDQFLDGKFLGRLHYSHPSLFIRFEGISGYIIGHAYGEGAPKLGRSLKSGEKYSYTRRVFRTRGDDEPGDDGTEVMEVGNEIDLSLDGKTYRVLDIRFIVTNPDNGYEYRERALMLREPALSLGSLGFVKGEEEFSSLPQSLSLDGDIGFRSMLPSPSCGEGT